LDAWSETIDSEGGTKETEAGILLVKQAGKNFFKKI
jgi:hypothetical protein